MNKSTKSKLKKKLDKAWSIKIRSSGECIKCLKTEHLNAHHIIGRRNLTVRWDLDNGVCLCAGCHTFSRDSAHQNPLEFHKFILELRGEDFIDNLRLKARDVKKWSIEELEDMLKELT